MPCDIQYHQNLIWEKQRQLIFFNYLFGWFCWTCTLEPPLMATSLQRPLFLSQWAVSCSNLFTMATSLQQQWPLLCAPSYLNSLLTMASFFQWLDGMVVKFDPYGKLMINCDNHIFIFSIFSAAVSKLFVFDIWFKSLFKLIFVYFICISQ